MLALLATAGAAHGAGVGSAAAQRLFEDARQLMSESRFAEACPKLAESQRLEPASGTLLNLALCHEQQGKTASAWLEYHQALSSSLRENNPERRQIAEQRIAAIEPRLSRIRLEPPAGTPNGLWIAIDEQPLGAEAWKVDLPVDPGRHRISYGAARRAPASLAIDVVDPGKTLRVPLPALRLAPAPFAPQRSLPSTRADAAREQALQRRWLLTGASFGLATTAFVSMTYFGIRAKDAWSDRDRHCASGCDAQAVEAGRTAHDFARVANVSFGVGVVGLGLGSYLLFTTLAKNKSSVSVAGSASTEQVSLTLAGSL